MSNIVINANTIYPLPTARSEVFTVRAEARVGDVRRTIEAVIDFEQPGDPQLLSWVVR